MTSIEQTETPSAEPTPSAEKPGWRVRLQHAWRPFRQASTTSRVLIFTGVGILVFFVLVAIFGPMLWGITGTQYRIETSPGQFEQIPKLAGPSLAHPFGTTTTNFDILARVIDGTKLALLVMILAVAYGMVIGVPLGLMSGYRGKKFDRILVTVMDAVYAFPPLVLAIMIAFVLANLTGRGVVPAAVAVGVVYIPQYFRVVRNQTLSVKQEPFVEAAQSLGAKERSILGRYVFFNVIHSVPVILTLNAADSILTLAALGFLGYGVEPPTPEWGYDISQAIPDVAAGIWWTALWPGLAIILLVTGLTLVGEGLNDIINPLLRTKGFGGRAARRHRKEQIRARTTEAERTASQGEGAERDDGEKDGEGELAVSVRDLRVGYSTPDGTLWAVDGVSFDLKPGESLGLVGESGCGKSTLGRSLLRLLPPGGIVEGSVEIGGRDLVTASESTLRKMRGEETALIFQEPMTRLNPVMKISDHFIEMIRTHQPHTSKRKALEMARNALAQMGIPPTRVNSYPHEFSGGMRQRVMIALSIVLEPRLVVADEPTTSLDVIVESQILDIMDRMRSQENVAMLFITHNLGIVAEACDKVAVMYAGKIVEFGTVDQIFTNPRHPYTRGLLGSTISLETTALQSIPGYPPNLLTPPTGCRYADRCPYAMPHCTQSPPELADIEPGQQARCFLYPGSGVPVPEDAVLPPEGNPQETGV